MAGRRRESGRLVGMLAAAGLTIGVLAGVFAGASAAFAGGGGRQTLTPQQRVPDLAARVRQIVSTARLGEAKVGISIVDLRSGRALVEIRADEPLIPASNLKLITTGAALSVLGPEFVFKTELVADGDRLILKGSGDPSLGDPAMLRKGDGMTVEQLLASLAGSVPKAGVSSVSSIVVDDRVFDRQWVHPTWPSDQLNNWYCAQVAGVNFHANVLAFFPSPVRGAGNPPPTLVIQPAAPWIEIDNRARSDSAGKNSVWLRRDEGGNKFTVQGEVAVPVREAIEVTLHDVPTFAGQLLAAELAKAGVSVRGAATSGGTLSRAELDKALAAVRLIDTTETYSGRTIAVVTTPLRDVVNRCNADSQNLYAEALIKRLGHATTGEPGSWTNGSSVMRMQLAQMLGPEAAGSTVIADGSGMSRDSRVSPRTLTRWLEHMAEDPKIGPMFVDSLATVGEGTLRRRFRDVTLANELHAKSGLLRQVRCLSGYVTGKDGQRLAFSIMLNDLPRGQGELDGRDLTEDVVVAIDRHLTTIRDR